jgi:hypothetical protein
MHAAAGIAEKLSFGFRHWSIEILGVSEQESDF